ncbi:MAG: ATP-binding protein [Chthoniobacterales bacterium]
MTNFLSPLKGWKSWAWAVFWSGLAVLLTYLFWGQVFRSTPFMLFFAAVAITASRSGVWPGMLVAATGVTVVLSHPGTDFGRLWLPSISMLFNAGIIVFLSSAVRRGLEAGQEAEAFRASIGDAVADFLWSCSPDGQPLYINDRLASFAGITIKETFDEGWRKYVHPDDIAELTPHFKRLSATGQKFTWSLRFRRKAQFYRWFQCRAVSIKNKEGKIVRWMGTGTDIHEQYLAEQQREEALKREKEARIEAENANRMKDEFLAMISHELRTPLNAVFGWLTLLKDPVTTPEEMQEGLEIIDRNAHAQGQLINDLLDMSGMIQGKIRLELESIDLSKIVGMAIESALPTALTKGIALDEKIEPNLGQVRGDPARLQQVVWNLLTNALKFTPKGGGVKVSLTRSSSSVELTVTDTGEGIAPDFLAYVFDRFRQGNTTGTRTHGGLGLGLAITRQLVELHGGTIRAESSGLGHGATFRVLLPLAETLAAPGVSSP